MARLDGGNLVSPRPTSGSGLNKMSKKGDNLALKNAQKEITSLREPET